MHTDPLNAGRGDLVCPKLARRRRFRKLRFLEFGNLVVGRGPKVLLNPSNAGRGDFVRPAENWKTRFEQPASRAWSIRILSPRMAPPTASPPAPENPETLWRVFSLARPVPSLTAQAAALGSVRDLLSGCDAVHVDLLILGQAARDGHFLTQIGFADGILVVDGDDVLGG